MDLLITIVILIIISIFFYVNYAYNNTWKEWENIDNDIYIVTKIQIFDKTINKYKSLVKQEDLMIKEVLNNEAIAMFKITNELIPVVWKNNKWLLPW